MTLLGTDIEQISRIQRVLTRTPGFVKKVFSKAERAYCDKRSRPAQHYAVRFCVKEAVAKALEMPVHWSEIEVTHDTQGAPRVRVSGETARKLGRRAVRVSLAHAGDYATATALIE
ncbi:MAG: holo-ACP synthase [Verrucomicrobia bacterium]|nr:holo-ACP synthase [Verrucomicrobiota bacterium]MBU4292403.1 holo-ACP synthase [Verrucomicrobiota bacterium]MBU4429777.1 holo-ACP synthase [Verrucomicrobiota bacterium]MBU4497346.1 holo-ACP synthase [Verrucomicrobiota bacterium]MCG2679826.1 holo-ACP synthase [Kiritimatiellia bacterium]